MPGFNIGGTCAGNPSNVLESRRVYRWTFSAIGRGSGSFSTAELLLLKSASRPKFKLDDSAKMDHVQETVYFAGKQSWEPVELIWYDIEQNPDTSAGIYNWLETVVQLDCANVGAPSTYKKNAILNMINGSGVPSETWTMYGAWPYEFDWKNLEYSQNELETIVVKMRYDRAIRSCYAAPAGVATQPSCPVSN